MRESVRTRSGAGIANRVGFVVHPTPLDSNIIMISG
jgi:hypothetical protein